MLLFRHFAMTAIVLAAHSAPAFAESEMLLYHFEQNGYEIEVATGSYGSDAEMEDIVAGVSAQIEKYKAADPRAEFHLETAYADFESGRGPSQVGSEAPTSKKFATRLKQVLGFKNMPSDAPKALNLDKTPTKTQQFYRKYGGRIAWTTVKASVTGSLVYVSALSTPGPVGAAMMIALPSIAALIATGATSNFLNDFQNDPKYRLENIQRGLKAVGTAKQKVFERLYEKFARIFPKALGTELHEKMKTAIASVGSESAAGTLYGEANFFIVEALFGGILILPQKYIHDHFVMPYEGPGAGEFFFNTLLSTAVQAPYEAAGYRLYKAVEREGTRTPEQLKNFRAPLSALGSIGSAVGYTLVNSSADFTVVKGIGYVTLAAVRLAGFAINKYVDKKYGTAKEIAEKMAKEAQRLECDQNMGGTLLKSSPPKLETGSWLWNASKPKRLLYA
ncbi:MAG: hypothetical protein H7333_11775 [Bdellovibrionales bacterium]|nr:hypothetical protein [Oligoflexia bacterium]